MNSNGQNMWGTDVPTCLPQHAGSNKFPLQSAQTATLTEATSTCTDVVLLNSILMQLVIMFCASMPRIFQRLVTFKNCSPVPVYDFHISLNFVFSAIGTSWLNTDVESCLDEQKCQRINSQRTEEVI